MDKAINKYKILQFGLKQDADVAYEIYSVLHRAALICHKLHYNIKK